MTNPNPPAETPPAGGETPPPGQNPPNETSPAVTAEDVAKLQKALDAERDLRKARERDLSEIRSQAKASMTEAERKEAEAEERGRQAAVATYGQRLARTEYIAEAAKRNPGYDVASVLDDLNLAKFIGEDGEPNSKAIAASVARLVPEGSTGPTPPPSFDGGTRQAAPGGADFNQMLRQAAGRA